VGREKEVEEGSVHCIIGSRYSSCVPAQVPLFFCVV